MSNEANSRSTVPFPRWGETTAQVPNANVVEPSGGKKDIGWIPGGEGIVGEWWNWLHWAAGVFFRYIENVLGLGLTANHVMAGAAAGEGLVTAGAGLTVNVASSRDWITGQMQLVPAAVNLALAAADPTNPRVDLVVARVTGGAPLYAVRTGTPGVSPSAPAALDGDAPHAEVRVEAAGVVPGTITDRREFGKLSLARIIAVGRLDAGSTGGSDAMLYVDGPTQQIRFGTIATPGFSYATAGGLVVSNQVAFQGDISGTPDFDGFVAGGDISLTGTVVLAGDTAIAPESFEFLSSITRKYDMSTADFKSVVSATIVYNLGPPAYWSCAAGNTGTVHGAVRLPNGVVITAVRVRGTKTTTDAYVLFSFQSASKAANASVFAEAANNNGSATGAFALEVTGLSHAVDQNEVYYLGVALIGGSGTVQFWSAEIEYSEDTPFDGL